MKAQIAPAGPQGSWGAMLTWRVAVLGVVLILALAVLLPTVRVYLAQQQELAELRAELAAARGEVDGLEAEVARWDDPAFVQAQARERLTYVFPGETPYRVIDPEFVTTHAEGSPASERSAEARADGAWYDVLWESVLVAGNGEPIVEPEPTDVDDAPGEPLTDVDFGG